MKKLVQKFQHSGKIIRQKEYPTTPIGLIRSIWDKTTGNDTYEVSDELTELEGEPSIDMRTSDRRNQDYWAPTGFRDRWIASMENNTNPLVGIKRTFVPAIAISFPASKAKAVVQGTPTVIKAIPRAVKTVYNTVRTNPQLIRDKAVDFGAALVKGAIGGEAVDTGMKIATGKNFGEYVAPMLGIPETVASFFNPGFALGAKNFGLRDALRERRALKIKKAELQKEENALETMQDALKVQSETVQGKINDLYDKINELASKKIKLNRDMRDADWRVVSNKKRDAKRRQIARSKIYREQLPPIDQFDVQLKQPIILLGSPMDETQAISFLGKSATVQKSNSAMDEVIDQAYWKSPGYIQALKTRVTNGGFPIITGDTTPIQESIGKYITELENKMGDDGIVAGSLVSYRNGLIKGTLDKSGKLIGPADTEIYTTRPRLESLKKKLEFKQYRNNSIGGSKGTSPYTFRANDLDHRNVDTEINLIDENADGFATGKLAHQIYRSLFPEEYSKLAYDYTMNPSNYKGQQFLIDDLENLPLPIKAEDLFQLLRNPKNMQRHLLSDMVSAETFTKPDNIKHKIRQFNVLLNTDPKVQQSYSQTLQNLGKTNLGSQFKLGTELYPNLSFKDYEANAKFLQEVLNISEEEAKKFATDEQLMRNVFNTYNFEMSTGVRMVGNDVVAEKTASGLPYHNAKIELFTGDGAFSGGTGSGAGINTALLNPYGGWRPGRSSTGYYRNVAAITQRPLTYKPEEITTPYSLVEQVKHLQKSLSPEFYHGDLADFTMDKISPVTYKYKVIEDLRNKSKEQNVPVTLQMGLYDMGYSGGFAEPIAAGARIVSRENHPELGSLLKAISENKSSKTSTTLVDDIPSSARQEVQSRLNKILDRYHKIPKEQYRKWLRGERQYIDDIGDPFSTLRTERLPYSEPSWSYTQGYELAKRRQELLQKLQEVRFARIERSRRNQTIDIDKQETLREEERKILSELTEIGQKIKKAHREASTERYLLQKNRSDAKKSLNHYKKRRDEIRKQDSETSDAISENNLQLSNNNMESYQNQNKIMNKRLGWGLAGAGLTLANFMAYMSNKNQREQIKHLVDEGYDLSNPTVRNLIADKDWRTLYRYYDPRYLKNQEQ